VVNADHRKLCAAALTGAGSFEIDGRPVLDDYTMFREPDGTLSMLVDVTPAQRAILRRAQSVFKAGERQAAAGLRASAGAFSTDALHGRLRQHHVLVS
jgi:hypothetical protein